jgi:ribonuclease P protein subunit POP4
MDEKVTEGSLYSTLPLQVLQHSKLLGANRDGKSNRQLLTVFLQRHVDRRKVEEGLEDELKHQQGAVTLDNTICRRKNHRKRSRLSGRVMSTRQFKDRKLLKIDPKDAIYELYLPLHNLWNDYINDLICFEKLTEKSLQDAAKRLMNADLHAALLHVMQSKCPSLVGVSGLVLQETKNTFRLVTADNKLKTIPKQNTVFCLPVGNHKFMIYGNNFRQRASERCVGSFKSQRTIDL